MIAALIADNLGMYPIFIASFAAYVAAVLVLLLGVKID
jgi:hypothetical protein